MLYILVLFFLGSVAFGSDSVERGLTLSLCYSHTPPSVTIYTYTRITERGIVCFHSNQ